MPKIITVNDAWQTDYRYELNAPKGKRFDPEFKPDLSPKQMLDLGVFGGSYFFDKPPEFPDDWFDNAQLTLDSTPNPELNFFKIDASQPLSVWQDKGWIVKVDPRGWFQWYCRYYLGRRLMDEDKRQVARWKAMGRHIAQIKKHCQAKELDCRRRQRQALLHWAIDSRQI